MLERKERELDKKENTDVRDERKGGWSERSK